VLTAAEGIKGLKLAETESPDVVILDLGLPDMDGLDVLRELRSFSNVPLLILTVRGEEMDKVKGLEMGADDYVVKPFAPAEFLSRVKAVVRRCQFPDMKVGERPLVSGRLRIDFAAHEVTVNGQAVRLTPSEYKLLQYLARNEGRVLSNQLLLEKVWGPEYTTETDYIKVYMQRLREKIEDDPRNPRMLISERGVGYKFVGRD